MKYLYLLLISLAFFSCGNERTLQLPEIKNATITEIHDVSHAYLFYDETKEDSVELNRKNLISTTNWLINVDKRLTLAQAIPKIKLLQEKKRNAKMHKNENAKNYFTCNDTSIENLGFLEFTDVNYTDGTAEKYYKTDSDLNTYSRFILISYKNQDQIYMFDKKTNKFLKEVTVKEITNYLNSIEKPKRDNSILLSINFSKNLKFNNYISLKHAIEKVNDTKFVIDNNEFIY